MKTVMREGNCIEKNLARFAFWDKLNSEEKAMATQAAAVRTFAKNQVVASGESFCLGLAFVLQGALRTSLLSADGREITLHRIPSGEACVATAACVIKQITFETTVTATEDTTLIVIPSSVVEKLSRGNIYLREFIFETETERYSQAVWLIQQMIFKRLDQRLAEYLVSEYEDKKSVDLKITQEEIARNINSAREVVARMMRHFAEEGLVEVKRGHIILKDVSELKKFL